MGKHIIMNGDCLIRTKEIGDKTIYLTITSPPYLNAKSYNKENDNIGNNENYKEYLLKIETLIKELYRITIKGGTICFNTSPVIEDGIRYPLPFDINSLFVKNGFTFLEDIVWVKPSGAAKLRCGGWVQNNGRPTTWHPNITTEYIMIYKKPGDKRVGDFDKFSKYYSTTPKDLLTNVWFINPETQTHWHDAPFPEELVKRCILLYSFKGETVFDPFLGSGTVMKVARELGRNSIGIELSPEYLDKAKEKLGFYQKNLFSNEVYIEK